MGQNATQILVRSIASEPPSLGFEDFFIGRLKSALSRNLGLDAALGLHRRTQPRDAPLRSQLQKRQPMAALPQVGGSTGYLFVAEALVRQIVATRLGARFGGDSMTAIDLALGALLPDQVQLILAQWHPTRPLPASPLQFGPLQAGRTDDWLGFEFILTLGNQRSSRFRLVLPAHLAQPPKPVVKRPILPPSINPTTLDNALKTMRLLLRVVLHRTVMDASQLADLREGDMIELPPDCLDELTVELNHQPSVQIAQARLGAFNGQKMLKLLAPPDASQLQISSK